MYYTYKQFSFPSMLSYTLCTFIIKCYVQIKEDNIPPTEGSEYLVKIFCK